MTNIPSIESEQPETLRDILVDAGLFLVAYELIRDLIIKPVELFYSGVTYGHGLPFSNFETDVSSRDKHKFDACLLWLRDHMEAITCEQYKSIHRVREFRDTLTHKIHKNICNHNFLKASQLLLEAKDALFALDNFWIRMEIQADPEFSDINDWTKVYSNSFSLLDMLLEKTR